MTPGEHADDDTGLDLVTGAFGNTGRAVANLLLADGRRVRTLTDHPPGDGRGDVEVRPYRFDDPAALASAFAGVTTFYNTFWMRLGDESGYRTAIERSQALIRAAERAGVDRIVQLSVAHADADSPYPYFRAKAEVEATVRRSRMSATVIRPALVFGGTSELLHQLAWVLRRSPVFAVADGGDYRVRPVHVDDVPRLCTTAGAVRDETVVDAVGPERPTFRELVVMVRDAIGTRTRLVSAPSALVLAASGLLGRVLGTELLSREELRSTIDGIADTDGPATGAVRLSDWLAAHGSDLGRHRPGR